MTGRRTLGRQFGWLWAAFAVSSYGTGLGFGAFSVLAILVLHSGPTQVAVLAASGRAVGSLIAVPLAPWVEFRRKRPVMIAMDLTRFAALLSIPFAYALGGLTFAQLLLVSITVAAANIAFNAASGAYLKSLVPPEDLLVANARFESTTWTSTMLGPPLGGAAIGLLGPVTTVVADAASYLLSALGIRAIGGTEPHPERTGAPRLQAADLLDGWRYILAHPTLRPLLLNAMTVNGLIMASEPLLAVLLLGHLGFAPWQFALALAASSGAGGFVGSRLARPLAARFGQHRVLLTAGTLRACWPLGLAFVGPGVPGMLLVAALQLAMVTCIGVFNPLLATARLTETAPDRVARTLTAWSVSTSAAIALTTAAWGWVAAATTPRTAIALAGVLLLASPLLLPRREPAERDPDPSPSSTLSA
ncbi:MFS transporter [Streptomyces hokutonensis]|uniref:MFS transporter n=1 Tax=Streptomyces hokutonensis TaxID=1306990 RepID=UPI00035D0843|nr:MFS transporter [Streptomyces hokutonensis]